MLKFTSDGQDDGRTDEERTTDDNSSFELRIRSGELKNINRKSKEKISNEST